MRLTCFVAYLIVVSTCAAQAHDPDQPQGRIIGLVVNDVNEPSRLPPCVRQSFARMVRGPAADRRLTGKVTST